MSLSCTTGSSTAGSTTLPDLCRESGGVCRAPLKLEINQAIWGQSGTHRTAGSTAWRISSILNPFESSFLSPPSYLRVLGTLPGSDLQVLIFIERSQSVQRGAPTPKLPLRGNKWGRVSSKGIVLKSELENADFCQAKGWKWTNSGNSPPFVSKPFLRSLLVWVGSGVGRGFEDLWWGLLSFFWGLWEVELTAWAD